MRATGLCWLVTSMLLIGCAGDEVPSGFAGLGALAASAEGFEQANPSTQLRFPADHGAHPGYRIEWWYLTANLTDAAGQQYGVQWTLFRSAQGPDSADNNPWHDPQVYMAHFAISSETDHVAFQRYARGGEHGGLARAGAAAEPFRAWLDDWSLSSLGEDRWAPLELFAQASGYQAALTLSSQVPLVLQGAAGFSQKHPNGGGSHYYSQPFFQTAGTLTIDGQLVEVSGQAWLDREWSSQFLQADQTGWDWFAVHLESGEKLMLFQLRSVAGAGFRHGVLIQPDGSKQTLSPDSIRFVASDFSRIAGRQIPTTWEIHLADIERAITVTALQPDQWMSVDFAYWEGPVNILGATPGESGVGYLEMVGY